jgi:hypothetical protein
MVKEINFVRLNNSADKRDKRITSIIPNLGGYTQCYYTVVSQNCRYNINSFVAHGLEISV